MEIYKNDNFIFLCFKNQLFVDIKNYLIGDFNYNSIQKKVLSSIFKNKNKTLAIIKTGVGLTLL